jgi:hypothetical protein
MCTCKPKHTTNYYKIGRMLIAIINKGGKIRLCGDYIDTCGVTSLEFIESCTKK